MLCMGTAGNLTGQDSLARRGFVEFVWSGRMDVERADALNAGKVEISQSLHSAFSEVRSASRNIRSYEISNCTDNEQALRTCLHSEQ